ncbi:MAG: Spx/MgsR family RNA polymerase-binding regulatory protein [Limisphaerales bacterium]
MRIRIYAFSGCDTCRRALRLLEARQVDFEVIAIRESPPTPAELRRALAAVKGDLRRLFNTSGQEYRRLNLKDSLAGMSPDEAIELLSRNGHLVKRPLLFSPKRVLVGFKEDEWTQAL